MLALLAAASATTDLRITFTKVASPKAGAIGLSGIRLLDADGEALDVARITNPGGEWTGPEGPWKLLDDDSGTKWVDAVGFEASTQVGHSALYVTLANDATFPASIEFVTANHAPKWDPVSGRSSTSTCTWRHVEEWDDVAAPLARQQDYTMPFVLPFRRVSAATCHYARTASSSTGCAARRRRLQLSEVRDRPAAPPAGAFARRRAAVFVGFLGASARFAAEFCASPPPPAPPPRPAAAQIKLFDPTGAEITGLSAANPGGIMSNKRTSNLVDGSTASKWFDEAIVGTGTSVVVLTLPAPAEVASYELYTGHDVPKRDPSSWRLERVTPGSEVELMSTVRNANPPAARQAAYDRRVASSPPPPPARPSPPPGPAPPPGYTDYQFVFTAAREREGGVLPSALSLSEIKLFRSDGSQIYVESVTNPGGTPIVSEGPDNLIDGRGMTKWLDTNAVRETTNTIGEVSTTISSVVRLHMPAGGSRGTNYRRGASWFDPKCGLGHR